MVRDLLDDQVSNVKQFTKTIEKSLEFVRNNALTKLWTITSLILRSYNMSSEVKRGLDVEHGNEDS